ncbi:uncharacterized protein PV09_04620 [Verruconis gallopava]|uniref:Uncharacterized protein n=1 Tax=Verruconis gallopava TaxID=253628 RepID=A0A0D2AYT4_9PEZI|nr:uncharacterized protein PV09_04620 [Verruconis gallopava]KIW04329.1 hypothetical protein PV09_04620 [Verruconis gallopava]
MRGTSAWIVVLAVAARHAEAYARRGDAVAGAAWGHRAYAARRGLRPTFGPPSARVGGSRVPVADVLVLKNSETQGTSEGTASSIEAGRSAAEGGGAVAGAPDVLGVGDGVPESEAMAVAAPSGVEEQRRAPMLVVPSGAVPPPPAALEANHDKLPQHGAWTGGGAPGRRRGEWNRQRRNKEWKKRGSK